MEVVVIEVVRGTASARLSLRAQMTWTPLSGIGIISELIRVIVEIGLGVGKDNAPALERISGQRTLQTSSMFGGDCSIASDISWTVHRDGYGCLTQALQLCWSSNLPLLSSTSQNLLPISR